MTKNKLKTLLFDIETRPNLGYTWEKYETNVLAFEKQWSMISFSYKWLGDPKTYVYALPDFPLYSKDTESDKELVKKLWELLDEADIVVAHNGNKFDIKKANSRFIVHGMNPPSPYKTVDTLLLARKYFGFNSNRLNDLGTTLGLGSKTETGGFKLWIGCMSGDSRSWSKMKRYNKNDVILLEKVYLKLRPWQVNHPNVGILHDGETCHACGSTKIQKRGYNYTKQNKYQRYVCTDCGSWSQGKLEKN